MSEKNIVYDATADSDYEERLKIEKVRDDSEDIVVNGEKVGKITQYKFKILVRDKPDLVGAFSREEMELIYRLYSAYGSGLTQKSVSLHFPDYTLQEFKKILRAFNITKSGTAPFPPHVLEETDPDKLLELNQQNKERDYLKLFDQKRNQLLEKRFQEVVAENNDLKQSMSSIDKLLATKFNYDLFKPLKKYKYVESDNDLILHLSDFHIGAKVRSTSLFKNEYNYSEVKRRLQSLLYKLINKKYDTIIFNLLGDMVDGLDSKTARGDHIIPQNMDNEEQYKAFLEIMEWFIMSIYDMNICNNMKFYSVRNGNHDGMFGKLLTEILFLRLKALLPKYEYVLFDEFFGYYKHKGHSFLITHGKDDEFMKRGMPLNLDDKTKNTIINWLDSKGIHDRNVHVIKGDLHSDNLNSNYRIDYRNVLSLFGSSDYSNFNFDRNNYGVSYEVINGEEILRGRFVEL